MEKDIQKKIAVLLTVFNRRETTLCCLDKLFSNDIPPSVLLDIYLVDDGCTDGTPEAIKNIYPQINVIRGDGNLYWNRGMWTAWNEASKVGYDYYLWLNDDTDLYSNAINLLVDASARFNNQAIVVGATEDCSCSHITYGGRVGGEIPIPDGRLSEVDYFNGNIVLVPEFVYNQLGNLDYYFSHSKGDFDYGMRAKKKGIKMYQVGSVLGKCDEHICIDKWCNPMIPLHERWKALWRPTGMPPQETFHFESRHFGFIIASFHVITIFARCLFPKLWI